MIIGKPNKICENLYHFLFYKRIPYQLIYLYALVEIDQLTSKRGSTGKTHIVGFLVVGPLMYVFPPFFRQFFPLMKKSGFLLWHVFLAQF